MKNIALFFVVMFSLVMSGCSITPKQTLEVKEIKKVTVEVPEDLITPCHPKKPITVLSYTSLSPNARERYLTNYVNDLLLELSDCNKKISGIKEIINESKPRS